MMDTRNPSRPSRKFSRVYVAPALAAHLDGGGTLDEWLAGRQPLASYARISADQLDGEAVGIGRQHGHNTANALLHGCAVVMHYEDNNITAAKREVKRPAFLQMVENISSGQEEETGIPIRGCIAIEKKRVYRLPRDFVALQDALILGGEGIFIEEKRRLDFVNDDGDIISGLVTSGTGESEVRDTRNRTRRNAVDRAKEGKRYGAPRRFGWHGASKAPYRETNEKINPTEWPHMINMIKRRAQGKSWRSITGQARKDGVVSVRGNPISEAAVKTIVTNPAWWGGRVINGELIKDPRTGNPMIGDWEHATEEKDGVGYETWALIMAGIKSSPLHSGMKDKDPKEKEEQPRTRSYLWSGYTKCGRINELGEPCLSGLNGNKQSGKNAKYGDIYRCGDPSCKGIARRAAPVDAYLTGLLMAYMDKHFSGTEEKTAPWPDADNLENLVTQRSNIKRSLLEGESDWSDVGDLLSQVNRRISTLEEERTAHLQNEQRRNLLRGWSHAKWQSMDLAQKRKLIGEVISAVIVMPIPEGRGTKAPFDPTLLRVSWKKPKAPSSPQGNPGREGDRSAAPVPG
ncbi:recombinase family protein [Streptomyces californicus]|uniref:recombinase family protein n=1 Tax=Streptomyces californicus TaxID=67351 RepID=UPI0033C05A9C